MGLDKIDYSQIDPELIKKAEKWEANKPDAKQLVALNDLQAVLEHLVITMTEGQDAGEETTKQLGALLTDIRTSLASLDAKETPESPDYASPVVEAVGKLETALTKALAAVEVKPEFTPTIHVDAPQVNVNPPSVDLKGVERVMAGLPAAFQAAIASIPETPETDLSPLADLLKEMSAKLDSIDTASRMKPLPATNMKVTNPDGSAIGSAGINLPAYDYVAPTFNSTSDVYVFRLGGIGGNTVATVTLSYTDSTKSVLSSVART